MQSRSNGDERRPNFLIIGAPKAGTTTLAAHLAGHPDVYLPGVKETRFFHDDAQYGKGVEYYLDTFFRRCGRYPARGEATPAYLRFGPKVIPRLEQSLRIDELRLIAIFRNPVQRAFSHYLYRRKRSSSHLQSFGEAIQIEVDALRGGARHCDLQLLGPGFYAEQLEPWLRRFERSRMLLVLHDDLARDPARFMRDVFAFLGVDPEWSVDANLRLNASGEARSAMLKRLLSSKSGAKRLAISLIPYKLRLSARLFLERLNTRRHRTTPQGEERVLYALREVYRDDVRRLEEILGRSLVEWY